MSDDTFTASDFESVESASSEPAASTTAPEGSSASVETAAQPDGATTQPAASATALAQPSTEPAKPAGPIPFDVHKTALDNARTKAIEEYKGRYGWAEQVDRQELQQVVEMARRASTDPIGYLKDFIKDLQNDPAHSQALRSEAARALAQRQHAQTDLNPIKVQLEDGRTVGLYSAEQMNARVEQAIAQLRQDFQPVMKTHETLQSERAQAARDREIAHFATTQYQDVTTWPGMDDKANQAKVADYIAHATLQSDDPREVALALNAAYRAVVLPTLHTASRQAVLNDINRQAAASTVNPAQTSTRAPKSMDDMSIAEALQFVASQQA